MSGSKKNIVRHKVDLDRPHQLSEGAAARLDAIKDGDIDYSDIPPLADEFWKAAARSPLYRPTKQATTLRLDADVLTWLKSMGKGYQTRINKILREAMLHEIKR